MANEEHLEILKQGVEAWNTWREEHPSEEDSYGYTTKAGVDLSYAHLRQVDLARANLELANLNMANLAGVDLTEANLNGASLYGALLVNADLSGANLTQGYNWEAYFETSLRFANLAGANLSGAHLAGADLNGVDLTGANLNGANLNGVHLGSTTFADTNLSGARGLERCIHEGPSTIDHRTMRKSGRLPKEFLQGCGLSDLEIEFVKLYREDLSDHQITDITYRIHELRAAGAIQYHSCFISYSSRDEAFAKRLHDDLQEKGVRCWFAPEDIKAGRKIHRQITDAIRLHDKLLLILSEHSMESSWVETEIRGARKRERTDGRQMLFPLGLVGYTELRDWELFDADEGRDLAAEVREYFIPDFSNWEDPASYQSAFERLLRDLRA